MEKNLSIIENINSREEMKEFLFKNQNLPIDIMVQAKKKLYNIETGKDFDFENPVTFNEKMQWLMVHYKNPKMTLCADKYRVREYIKNTIGEKYLVKLLGVYDKFDDIDFNNFPESVAMKVNWGSGQNIIIRERSKINMENVKNKFDEWMQPISNHYYLGMEWCYKNIEPKIVCEEYLESLSKSALDYKFMCFNGEPIYCWVSNKYKDIQERSFYDMNWNMQDIELVEWHKIKSPEPLPKPENFDEMKELATILCKGWPHIRVDFYKLDNGDIKFGELTFHTSCGYSQWKPYDVDIAMGNLINIDEIRKGEFYV